MLRNFILAVFVSVCWSRNPLPDHTDANFENEVVNAHNYYRQLHGANLLHLDEEILAYAKNRCSIISQNKDLSHAPAGTKNDLGENVYWGGNSAPTLFSGNDAVKYWYTQVKNYDFGKPVFSVNTGAFTQLVWKSTTKVGCGRCGGNGGQSYETYIVCNYSPRGNTQGLFAQNVGQRH